MSYALGVVWGCLLVGAIVAAAIGRVWGAKISLSVCLGMLLFFVVNAALAMCVEAKLCPALGDTGITYALYPIFAVPVLHLIAKLTAKRK